MEHAPETAISGSFQFKPEIDRAIEAFRDYGVMVLEPTTGWLWTPVLQVVSSPFRPLPAERGLELREVEDRFLAAIDRADFLYVLNPGGYIGLSTAFEIGYAMESDKPIYMQETPDFMELAEYDLARKAYLEQRITIADIPGVVLAEQQRREQQC